MCTGIVRVEVKIQWDAESAFAYKAGTHMINESSGGPQKTVVGRFAPLCTPSWAGIAPLCTVSGVMSIMIKILGPHMSTDHLRDEIMTVVVPTCHPG